MNTLEARIQQLEEQLARALQENQQLKLRIEELEEKLNTNSKNSSKPPSQDPYRGKRSKRAQSEKKQGGTSRKKRSIQKTVEQDLCRSLYRGGERVLKISCGKQL